MAKKILDKKSTVYGSVVSVYYGGGVIKDAGLLEKNNGKMVKLKGKLPVEN